MILARVHGGLGNQMFQYALGRHLAHRTGQCLRLEIGRRHPSHLGKFDLDRFKIVANVASKIEGALLWRPAARLVESARLPAELSRLHRIYIQRSTAFYEDVTRVTGSAYLVGYWQSERYFVESADLIREELTLKETPGSENARLIDMIRHTQSVAVHVRRGDYVTNPALADHAICGEAYYRKAWTILEQQVPEAECFVFSDDPAWCKNALPFLGKVTFVDNNSPEQRHEDMRLMSQSKHFILSNSSFGWWGAWLSTHPGKVVVAPSRWSAVEGQNAPQSWIRISP